MPSSDLGVDGCRKHIPFCLREGSRRAPLFLKLASKNVKAHPPSGEE